MSGEVRYLPRLVVDNEGRTWPEVEAIGVAAWVSGNEDIPLSAIHMDLTAGEVWL